MSETMNTGDVGRRIGVPVTAELLDELGFKPAGRDKRAVLWRQSDYPAMCVSLADWIKNRQEVPMQPAPSRVKKTTAPAAGAGAPFDNDDEF